MADDLEFTFDTSFFETGVRKVIKGFSNIDDTAAAMAKGVNKGLTRVIGKLGAVFAGFKSIKSALLDMPEVGQAFGIAKDIFSKNLLFPLRKEIFPLLQDMLEWVRDSRVRFVKWGQFLANIFRSVVSGIRNMIDFARQAFNQITEFAERIFGDRISNIEDIFNIVSFKLATVVEFISLLIKQVGGLFTGFFSGIGDIGTPLKGIIDNVSSFLRIFTETNEQGDSLKSVLSTIGELFGNILSFITQMTDKFLDGFVPAVSGIFTPLQNIADAWSDIFDSIFGSTEQIGKWGGLFESVGRILGNTVISGLDLLATILEKISEAIKTIQGGGGAAEFFLPGTAEGFFGNIGKLFGVNDGIIKPDGTVIKTNPKDTLVAMKDEDTSLNGLLGSTQNTQNVGPTTNTVQVDFSGMQIIIQGGTEQQGRDVAVGLVDMIREEFNRDIERFGIG